MKCVAWGTVENGVQIYTNNEMLCESGFVHVVEGETEDDDDTYYCMPGPVSKEDPTKALDSSVTTCEYIAFTNIDDPTDSTDMSEPPTCGFNSDNKAYCNQRQGDDTY